MAGTTEGALLVHGRIKVQRDSRAIFETRKGILSYFLRFESLEDLKGDFMELNHLLVDRVSKETVASKSFVISTLSHFLADVAGFCEFLRSGLISWNTNDKRLRRKVRLYLHKVHKIAPVFDYHRAVRNLELLHILLRRKFYWPHLSTQLALVVFVTDRNDSAYTDKNYILQKNLRSLCSCSAYAFHMVRNKLGINKEGKLSRKI